MTLHVAHRSRAARSPFVVTVALGAASAFAVAAGGCGGNTTQDGLSVNPPGASCPVDIPLLDQGCESGLSCSYDAQSSACPGTVHASCVGGQWSLQWDVPPCDPPPIRPPVNTECPATPPDVGSACNVAPTVTCNFANACCGLVLSCLSGAWQDTSPFECNPPAPICPVVVPSTGDPCTLDPCTPADLPCFYFDGCGEGQMAPEATCSAGTWTVKMVNCPSP